MAFVGVLLSVLMFTYPAQLRVPLWVALMASAAFVISGVAVALHAFVSAKTYGWCIVVLLIVLTCIPGWIAFGPVVRVCGASISLLEGQFGCRTAFALSTLLMIGLCLLAVQSAMKAKAE